MKVTINFTITRLVFSKEDGETVDRDIPLQVTGVFDSGELQDYRVQPPELLSFKEYDRMIQELYDAYEAQYMQKGS